MRCEHRIRLQLGGTLARRSLGSALAALCLTLAGCGGGNTAVTGSTQNSAMAIPKVAQVTNFGASITCGYYAKQQSPSGYIYSQLGYAGRFDATLNVPAQNLCRLGDQAADTVRTWVMPNTRPELRASQLYTVMVGTNDATDCGDSTACIDNWRHALTAALTWLSLPSSDKILGVSVPNLSSAWTPDLDFGVATTQANASLTFSVPQAVDGRTLYLAYRIFDSGTITPATASVQLDGAAVATLHNTVNTGHAIKTHSGLTDTIIVTGIPLGAVGNHTITLTTGASGGLFSFQWAGVSSATYAHVAGAPRVMAAMLPGSSNDALNLRLATYNTALTALVDALDSEGLYITLVPCGSTLNTSTDLADTVHPNDAGHQKLSTVFTSVF